MGDLGWNFDELVDKVMADLRGGRVVDSAAARLSVALTDDFKTVRAARTSVGEPSRTQNKEDSEDSESDGTAAKFVVAEKLLVAETVRRLAASTLERHWAVGENIVVTPSAKDELRKLGVELVVGDVSADKPRVTYSASNVFDEPFRPSAASARNSVAKLNGASGRLFWALHLPEGERFPAFVENSPFRESAFAQSRLSCLKETTKRIAAEIAQNSETKAILTTRDAAIASIWANRISGVRAVVAFSFEQTKRDVEAANANVLIVDPSDVGPYPFRRIVEFFATRSAEKK